MDLDSPSGVYKIFVTKPCEPLKFLSVFVEKELMLK